VTEQPGLDVLDRQRLAQQRVVEQVDLADREVVGGTPVRVQKLQFALRERTLGRRGRVVHAVHMLTPGV
jgi:hypothetical protein